MSSSERSADPGRRQWMIAVPIGLVALGMLARGWLGRSPASAEPSAFASLMPGQQLDRWTVVRVHPVHLGAVPVVLATEAGQRYQVDVLARDPAGPAGVANTQQLSLFVANHGDGRTATDEEQGLGAMALAEHLGAREAAGWTAPSLLTLEQRAAQYPEGAFGVPLS
jgi:hypothetical protein